MSGVRIEPDQLDLEALRATIETPGWRLIAEKRRHVRAVLVQALEKAPNWDQTLLLQGRLAQFDVETTLPKILADEIKARSKGKK